MPGLKQKAITGVKYAGISQVVTQGSRFLTFGLLALLLSPDDFGVVGMAAIVTGFVGLFQDFGTGAAIVQRDELSNELLGSVLIFNVAIAILATAVVFLSAQSVSVFFEEPILTDVMRVLSFTFLISSISIVPMAMLNHKLDFRSRAIIEISAAVVSGIVAIVLAIQGFGVWSLVFQTLTGAGVISILAWSLTRWVPVIAFSRTEFKSVFGFSSNLTAFSILNYFLRNADNFLIGKFLGSNALGIYSLAYRLMLFPVQNMSAVMTKVMFPVFSKTKHNNERFREGYLQMSRMISLMSFPAMVGVFVVAVPLVSGFLDPKWELAGWVLMILAPVGLLQSLMSTVGVIYQAKGRTDWMFWWAIGASFIIIPAFLIGINFGVVGVATGYLIAIALLTIPGFLIPFRLIQLSFLDLVNAVKLNFICSLIMGVCVFLAGWLTSSAGVPTQAIVIVQMILGVVVYGTLTFFWNRKSLDYFTSTLGISFGTRVRQHG